MQVSSIAASSANVSWTAASGAQWYYVYYKPVGSGSALYETVAGTSINLTNLDGCTDYEVTIRTYCDVNDISAATSPVEFETGNSITDYSITVDSVDNGCTKVLVAEEGYDSYTWSNSDTSQNTTYNYLFVTYADTFDLEIFDGGCSETNSQIVSYFPSGCTTFEFDDNLKDSISANNSSLDDMNDLLTRGLAGVMYHDTVLTVVKNIANSSDLDGQYYARIETIIDSCDHYSVDLVDLMQQSLLDNGASASDTTVLGNYARNGFSFSMSPTATLYPTVFFSLLNSSLHADELASWDGKSINFVYNSVFKESNYPYYEGDSLSTTVTGSNYSYSDIDNDPYNWAVTMTTDFLDVNDATNEFATGLVKAPCICGTEDNGKGGVSCTTDSGGGQGCGVNGPSGCSSGMCHYQRSGGIPCMGLD